MLNTGSDDVDRLVISEYKLNANAATDEATHGQSARCNCARMQPLSRLQDGDVVSV